MYVSQLDSAYTFLVVSLISGLSWQTRGSMVLEKRILNCVYHLGPLYAFLRCLA